MIVLIVKIGTRATVSGLQPLPLYEPKLCTLITGDVGGAGAGPPTCKMGTFFQIPLPLTTPISNNFQLNGASEESLKL